MNKVALGLTLWLGFISAWATDKPVKKEILKDDSSLPKWEIGIGAGGLHLPHYPGANQSQNLGLVFPYFIYRGDIVQASRSGIRTTFYNENNWKIDLSLGGSLPVNSEDNDARKGMDDLDLVGEMGPRLSYTAYKTSDEALVFRLPIRAAFSTDFSDIEYQGWIASLQAKYYRDINDKLSFSTAFTTSYADQGFHDYFYGVDASEVDPAIGRNQYTASAGYNGSSLSTALGWRHKRWYVAAYAAVDGLSGVAYDDSPLFRQSHGLYAGAYVIWTFWHSDERVSREHLIEEQ